MIRGQPVIFRPNEALEKEPGAAGQVAQHFFLFGGKRLGRVADRAADPVGDLGGKQPRDQERRRYEQRGGIEPEGQQGESDCYKHRREPLLPGHLAGKQAHGIGIGRPLQQVSAGDQQPQERSDNSAERDQRFIRRKNQRQHPTHRAVLERPEGVLPGPGIYPLNQPDDQTGEDRHGGCQQPGQRPYQRRAGQPQPTSDK